LSKAACRLLQQKMLPLIGDKSLALFELTSRFDPLSNIPCDTQIDGWHRKPKQFENNSNILAFSNKRISVRLANDSSTLATTKSSGSAGQDQSMCGHTLG